VRRKTLAHRLGKSLQSESAMPDFDLAIVGGGINGAGIAWRARPAGAVGRAGAVGDQRAGLW
jgi:hypothetical protein